MTTNCVITTINQPSAAVSACEKLFGDKLIVVGDEKTPDGWSCGKAIFFSGRDGHNRHIYAPQNHYARKNIGYLVAMAAQKENQVHDGCIFETDDDNHPNENFAIREEQCASWLINQKGWVNIYRSFNTRVSIWPRGLPLTQCTNSPPMEVIFNDEDESGQKVSSPIQQGVANISPDVDAIWRLTHKPYERSCFARKKSISLSEGVWCPINSQSTWWFPDAYPLMYLPVTATMRMCDIWRGFVAQRCLWAMGKHVTFHSPAEVEQNRNDHDLMSDFVLELPGYLHNQKIVDALGSLNLGSDVFENMRACYGEMVRLEFLCDPEMMALDAWIEDVKRITNGNTG